MPPDVTTSVQTPFCLRLKGRAEVYAGAGVTQSHMTQVHKEDVIASAASAACSSCCTVGAVTGTSPSRCAVKSVFGLILVPSSSSDSAGFFFCDEREGKSHQSVQTKITGLTPDQHGENRTQPHAREARAHPPLGHAPPEPPGLLHPSLHQRRLWSRFRLRQELDKSAGLERQPSACLQSQDRQTSPHHPCHWLLFGELRRPSALTPTSCRLSIGLHQTVGVHRHNLQTPVVRCVGDPEVHVPNEHVCRHASSRLSADSGGGAFGGKTPPSQQPLSANMLRGGGQICLLEGHTRRCAWTEEVGGRGDAGGAHGTMASR